jgi:hypothetical protein
MLTCHNVGVEQEERDRNLKIGDETGKTPNQLNYAKKLQEMYGYDVVVEVQNHFGGLL